ncbi:hypothetical protein Scep_016947 [Stephania cephalantha]|uniref:UspA domain-containing protein n=1 Tax=Stephania cephalantha TaxID=152367 RepID=A0AAP0NUM2_9MAGN
MEKRKIVVLVEDVEAARAALLWALDNLLRYGDSIVLLHVLPFLSSSSKPQSISTTTATTTNNKLRRQRLKGFHLALSFKNLCDSFLDAKVEIVVTPGDPDGNTIASMVRDIGASALVVGLHDQSFLYKTATSRTRITDNNNCRVLAIKHSGKMESSSSQECNSMSTEFSQIETGKIRPPPGPQPKIQYQIMPSPFGITWRSRRRSLL